MEPSSEEHQRSRKHRKIQKDAKDISDATWTAANSKYKFTLASYLSLSILLDSPQK